LTACAGSLLSIAFTTLTRLIVTNSVATLAGGKAKLCTTDCRLQSPAQHAQCLAALLQKFLQLQDILPACLLEMVEEWKTCCPLLFDLPQVWPFVPRIITEKRLVCKFFIIYFMLPCQTFWFEGPLSYLYNTMKTPQHKPGQATPFWPSYT
jgi:hypothetical protein